MQKKLLDAVVIGTGLSSLTFIDAYLERKKKWLPAGVGPGVLKWHACHNGLVVTVPQQSCCHPPVP